MSVLEQLNMLLDGQPVASLAVLEQGSPAVSLVPFVVQRDPLRFAIVISDLSGPHPGFAGGSPGRATHPRAAYARGSPQ